MILLLLIISLLGPWMFALLNVPAKYACSAPNIRLYGDFCGAPMSGIQIFAWFFGGFIYILLEMIRGTFAGRARELLSGIYILHLVPFFTTLFSIWKKETHRLRTINLIAWILALIPALLIIMSSVVQHHWYVFRLWGVWLYIVTAISAIILEYLVMKNDSITL